MAIEVKIPTILRTYTAGEKAVSAEGKTLSALIDDLEANHSGIKERLIDNGDLRRFVNVYINDEDVRFIGGLDAELKDGEYEQLLEMYDQSLRTLAEGEVVRGRVLRISGNEVIVDVGYKSEGIIDKDEFIRILPMMRKLAQGLVVLEPRQILPLDEINLDGYS